MYQDTFSLSVSFLAGEGPRLATDRERSFMAGLRSSVVAAGLMRAEEGAAAACRGPSAVRSDRSGGHIAKWLPPAGLRETVGVDFCFGIRGQSEEA